jgi:hypothetical protein
MAEKTLLRHEANLQSETSLAASRADAVRLALLTDVHHPRLDDDRRSCIAPARLGVEKFVA